MIARDDPRWQAAHADYLAERDDPDATYFARLAAATRMYEIEREYKPTLPTVVEALEHAGT